MSLTVTTNGRLGNQIFRNLAISFLAQKFDLKVEYASEDRINSLGIELFSGKQIFLETSLISDTNYFKVLDGQKLETNIDGNHAYFQTTGITQLIIDHLKVPSVRSNILLNNPYKNRYENNNDCFIHIRLGDVSNFTVGYEYYKRAIDKLCQQYSSINTFYIATDSPEHPIVNRLLALQSSDFHIQLILDDEVKTIQFGSTCKHLIISHGTFSIIIGFLAFFSSSVYFPECRDTNTWYASNLQMSTWNALPW